MEIILDFKNINDKQQFHNYLQKSLFFIDYDNNLDGLYDELSCLNMNIVIVLKNIDLINSNLVNYFNTFKQLLLDVMNINKNINIKIN